MKQFKRFAEAINEKCINRQLNLTNMFLGAITATLIAKWMMLGQIDITHLLLGQNNLGDLGLEKIAPAICLNKALISVDLSQNQFTPRSAHFIAQILTENHSIIEFNIGSM